MQSPLACSVTLLVLRDIRYLWEPVDTPMLWPWPPVVPDALLAIAILVGFCGRVLELRCTSTVRYPDIPMPRYPDSGDMFFT